MKKILLISGIIALALTAYFIGSCYLCAPGGCKLKNAETTVAPEQQPRFTQVAKPSKKNEKGIKHAVAFLHQRRANPATGRVELSDVLNARKQMYHLRQQQNSRGQALDISWSFMGPDNVGGRTRAILIDKNNPQRMYAGGVSGGMFVSDNGGLSWQQHSFPDDPLSAMGISSMAQAANGDIYVGTGEFFTDGSATDNASGFIGEGIFKSTDGGLTFLKLPSTDPLVPNNHTTRWAYVNEIAVDPLDANKVYAATRKGLVVSPDGGTSWMEPQLTNQGDMDGPSREVTVAGNGTVFASINRRYYLSTDGGFTFTQRMGQGNFPTSNVGRMEFTVSPQDPNTVYCLIATNENPSSEVSGSLMGVYHSVDGGLNWVEVVAGSTSGFNPLGNQGKYDMCIAVDPGNKERIFIGGQLSFWSYSPSQSWNMLAYWQPESYDNPYYIHADMHEIVFHPTNNNIMYVGTDGGIYQSVNAVNNFPTFANRNKGYGVTQFYAATGSKTGELLGGTQDNGTRYINYLQNTPQFALEPKTGDGGDVAFSWKKPNISFAEYVFGSVERSTNNAVEYNNFFDSRIDADGDGEPSPQGLFIAPFILWEAPYPDVAMSHPNFEPSLFDTSDAIFYLGTVGALWFTPDAINLNKQAKWYRMNGMGNISAIAASTQGHIFVGNTTGGLYRIDGLDTSRLSQVTEFLFDTLGNVIGDRLVNFDSTFLKLDALSPIDGNVLVANSPVTRKQINLGVGNRWLNHIAVDPQNANRVVITLGYYDNTNYVYYSTNALSATPTFTSVQGNLPAMPVYGAVIDYNNFNNVIIGTELGVWATEDITSPNPVWVEQNNGLPSIPVFTVRQEKLKEENCRILYIGTHGRGIYRSTSLTPSFCDTNVGIFSDKAIASDISHFSFYPNPVREQAIVEFELVQAAEIRLRAYDMLGRLAKEFRLGKSHSGMQKVTLDFAGLKAGTYILQVDAGKFSKTTKFNVTR